ncbi:MAG: hypothetical protein C4582_01265 [Desulfobacteraceae bacterium]|jgi:hypothetical protein|nr:MAG: hypothetical protein C4582_01265 [Desulfobacteraceae bacterium]
MQAVAGKEKLLYAGAFLAVFFGGLVYILWRPDNLRLFGWLNGLGLTDPVESLRGCFKPVYSYLPDWFLFSLPDGLWAFSYALLISSLWWGSKSWLSFFWLASIPLVGIGYEISQYVGIIPGTFCLSDLVFSACGTVMGFIFPSLAH